MKIIPVAVTGMYHQVLHLTNLSALNKTCTTGIGTTILLLYLMTDENARSFQVNKIRALKSALEMLIEKR